ncbi:MULTISPECIES: TlpA family protein disulfide reductase [Mesonia]|uniref:Thiol-disulfide oxidoreductase ResA n=1 Tax=Mesonia oceanica TaxID=2687242 RepID=A0AC61Y9P9_9FLAO|nr:MULTISPECIES: TlpA disulfide reductase family protein [Mesonia]MAN26086.1 thiol:disulfide interchange protein [Mesonia sp.]MAQ42219.1 thiol:disulfide interchange protein [Mesonia sp.]MBJ97913.1 thiol:disulfide interchange protein [Flavobacteriaceae bacterium]VVV00080.1 Thiol-disulfide oxidoreductase ResA [Mesonia oceanica]|tara:strand:+ start:92 stop:574 length:483 start_codon:yes stop_codon:yes gene_type:complete
MRKLVFIFSIFCAISTVEAQENIPSVDIETINGKEINTHDISEDKLVVISLWATWCVPCLKELDAINDVYVDWQDETGIELYAISVDDARTVKRVRPLVSGKGWDYNVLLDTNNDFKRLVGAASVPLTLLVKDNKILYRHSGYSPGAEEELYDMIKQFSN